MLLNFYCLKTLKFHYFSTSIIKKIPVVLKLETTILLIGEGFVAQRFEMQSAPN